MTNEQKLLVYLYGVDSIQHKQIAIALSDIPYQCVTKALRAAKKHGYVEVFMRDESRYVRISPDGLKYIRSTQKDALDVDKRAAMKRRIKGEQGRLTRVETTLCMCRAAGIQPAKEAGIKLIDVLDPEQDATQTFMNDFFYDKGLLFLSDEISATIKTSTTMGEEYTLGQSRLVGIVINRTGISFLYCTLDKLMRWVVSYEQRRVSAVMELLKSSSLAATDEDFATICNMSPKCIVIGKTCAIVPKIITGDKYGKAIDSTDIIKTHNATRLLTLTNLEQVYKYSYFVPTSSIGVELLARTAALTRNELNEMISVWLDEMVESHTTVTTGRYVEAYINEQKCKTITLPVIEFEELEYQKNGRVPYHVVCERGTQDGISRALGSKVLDFKDFDNIPMPAHKYDDDGIRRDGINPLTHNGYNEEEMDDQTILKLNLLLNTNLNGVPIQDINLGMIARLKEQAGSHSGVVADVLDAVAATIHVDEEDMKVYTSGATNIFKYPELADTSKASELISTFEDKQELADMVRGEMGDSENTGVQVYIGDEVPVRTMKDCSVVTATYELGDGMRGTIGIIGPKRMDYENVVDSLKKLKVQLDEMVNKKT